MKSPLNGNFSISMNKHPFKYILKALAFLFVLNSSLYAQCDSTNSELSDKIRYLGGWNSNGRPEYLEDELDTVSAEIKEFVNTVLPESVNITESGYFDEDIQPNTELKDTAEVYVTFIHEGAAWKNAFGFYTYDLDNPPLTYQEIDSLNIVFPNVDSVSAIKAGDQVYLGEFMPNTGIGYFVIAQGWKGDTVCLGRHIIFSDKRLNINKDPAYRQQSILLNNETDKKLLLGIEDQLRPSGDKDFNDIVFHISVTPEHALDTNGIPKIPTALLTGDTTLCDPEDEAELQVKLTGTGPWTLVYNDGTEDITVENIQDTLYTIKTTAKDTVTLVSVQDSDGYGIVSGSAIIKLSGTNAAFNASDMALCEATIGKAKVNLTGNGPFDLLYTDGSDTTLLTDITEDHVELGVEAGKTYTLLEVSDKYCTITLEDSIEVFQSDKPTATVTGGGVVCTEDEKLNVVITFEGTAPYTFAYEIAGEKDTVVTSSNPLNIALGPDSVLTPLAINDANCKGEVSGSAGVSLSDEISATLSGIDTAFCGVDSAALKVALKGVPPFAFELTNGAWKKHFETSETEMIVYVDQSGIYEVSTVSDQNCQGQSSGEVEVTQHDGPVATVSGGGSICDDASKVNAIVSFEGPAPYSFVYDLNDVRDTTEVNDATLEIALEDGDKLVPFTVFNNTCSGTVSGNAEAYLADKPEIALSKSGSICGDEEEINVNVSFTGNAPFTYKYLLNEEEQILTTSESSVELTLNLNDSIKSVSLEDANCLADLNTGADYDVVYYQAPTAEIAGSTNICNGTSASITLSFTGNAPWTAEIKNGDFSEVITSDEAEYEFVTDLTGTFELVSVSDAHCDGTVSGEAIIGEFEQPTASLSETGEICGESGEFAVQLTFTGQAPFTYNYQINGEAFDATTTNETIELILGNADEFELTAFEDANCSGVISDESEYSVVYHQSPTAEISGGSNICNGDIATINIKFTGNGPWTTEIVNGDFSETIVSSEAEFVYETDKTGTYSLSTVTDAYCEGTANGEVTIGEFDKPTAELTGETSFCSNSTATLDVALNGEAPFSFNISNGTTVTQHTTSEPNYTTEVSEAGTYFIADLQDANCTGEATGSVEIIRYEAPTATISGGGSICADESVDVTIEFTGEPPYTFVYSDGTEDYEATSTESTYTFSTNKAGTYTLVSVANAQCDGSVSGEAIVTNVIDELEANINAEDSYCEQDPIDLSLSVDGTFETITWSSDGQGSFTSLNAQNTEYKPADGETGEVTIFADIDTQCGSKQISQVINIVPTPNALFDVGSDEELKVGDEIVFNPEVEGYDEYSWDFGDENTGEGDPGMHVYAEPGIYTVRLAVTNQGCSNGSELAIELFLDEHLYVPNVFNPSSNEPENRVVKVYGAKVSEQEFTFKILNRWGNIMYQTNSFAEANSKGWDGHEMNNEEMQALSSFTYILRGKFESGVPFEETGTITLLR